MASGRPLLPYAIPRPALAGGDLRGGGDSLTSTTDPAISPCTTAGIHRTSSQPLQHVAATVVAAARHDVFAGGKGAGVLRTNVPAAAVASRMPAAAPTAEAAPTTGHKSTSSVHFVRRNTAAATPASATVATTAPCPRWEASTAGAATTWRRVAAHQAGSAATRRPNEVRAPAGTRWAMWQQRRRQQIPYNHTDSTKEKDRKGQPTERT